MGFWTLGPVVGSLGVSVVTSTTLDHVPRWQTQYVICGVVGLVVFLIALVGLRELAPSLRDQLMVSSRDRGALILTGVLSDRLRVRKPFMVVGAVGAIVMTVIFALRATQPGTSYNTFVVILVLLAAFLGVAYAPWMASFPETVERHNPASFTATGLAVWGLVIRLVIAVSVIIVPLVVATVTILVEKGPVAQELAVKYR